MQSTAVKDAVLRTMRRKLILPTDHPCCPCGGPTRLERIESHPIHGNGFEVRVFVCSYCGKEATTETTPDKIDLARQLAERDITSLSLIGRLRSLSRMLRSRGRSAKADRALPLAQK